MLRSNSKQISFSIDDVFQAVLLSSRQFVVSIGTGFLESALPMLGFRRRGRPRLLLSAKASRHPRVALIS